MWFLYSRKLHHNPSLGTQSLDTWLGHTKTIDPAFKDIISIINGIIGLIPDHPEYILVRGIKINLGSQINGVKIAASLAFGSMVSNARPNRVTKSSWLFFWYSLARAMASRYTESVL